MIELIRAQSPTKIKTWNSMGIFKRIFFPKETLFQLMLQVIIKTLRKANDALSQKDYIHILLSLTVPS